MLLSFRVTNYLSFDETTEFNMRASNVRRHPQHIHKLGGNRILKSSVIYGANGSGKSNLIHAMRLLNDIVSSGELIEFSDSNKFKLNPSNSEKPVRFEVDFLIKKAVFTYSLEFNENTITSEWLKKLGGGNKEDLLLFKRVNTESGKIKLKFADKYLKSDKNKVLREVYQDDLLEKGIPFIYLARNQKFKEITLAHDWISHGIIFIFPDARFRGLAGIMNKDTAFREFTNKLIEDLGTGIKELRIKTIDFNSFFGEDNESEKDKVLKSVLDGEEMMLGDYRASAVACLENGKPVVKKLTCIHETLKYGEVEFELYEESEGSLRLLDFLPAFHLVLTSPVTIIIDEIDQSIHVNLLKQLVTRLQESGDLEGQLIFSTHESNLLDLNLFRQDEIWFTEKDNKGATHLCQLNDFDVRTEVDITKGYLTGKYGAIPFLGDFTNLRK